MIYRTLKAIIPDGMIFPWKGFRTVKSLSRKGAVSPI